MTAPLRAKKSLGQNFLSSPHYLKMIADAGAVAAGDVVLEVGPGKGALTRELLSRGARVIAVEKDRRLIPHLNESFAEEIRQKRLTLIEGDILEENLSKLKLRPGKYKVVANIPYYISGALLRLFLSHRVQPSCMTLLLQREVAERIAKSKKESLLSLSVKAYGTPVYVAKVPRGAFTPVPKVDSAILSIQNISRDLFANKKKKEDAFFTLIHAGFAHKRKKLGKALEPLIGARAEGVRNRRAEDLVLSDWLALL